MNKTLIITLLLVSLFYFGSCSDDETTTNPPPGSDTTVAIYNNLLISERTLPFDEALSAVDFFRGLILLDSSSYKDANLIDSIALGDSAYYFRSGDLSDFPYSVPGYKTRFKLINLISSQAVFDTMKVIPDSDTLLTEDDFTSDNTESFRAPLLFNTVYGFYLKGKYDNNVTPYRVFGMLYLDESYNDTTGFKLRFDVKINKIGENRFQTQ